MGKEAHKFAAKGFLKKRKERSHIFETSQERPLVHMSDAPNHDHL